METFPISEVPFPEVIVCPPLGSNTALNYDLMTAENITIDYEHPLKSDFEGRDKILEVGFKDSQHNHETNFNYNNH